MNSSRDQGRGSGGVMGQVRGEDSSTEDFGGEN